MDISLKGRILHTLRMAFGDDTEIRVIMYEIKLEKDSIISISAVPMFESEPQEITTRGMRIGSSMEYSPRLEECKDKFELPHRWTMMLGEDLNSLILHGKYRVDISTSGYILSTIADVKQGNYCININKAMMEGNTGKDRTIILDSGSAFGCHSAYLSALGQGFSDLVQGNISIRLRNMSDDAFRCFLCYTYYSDLSMVKDFETALDLLLLGNKYNGIGLMKEIAEIMVCKPNEWLKLEKVDIIFTHFGQNQEFQALTKKIVDIMRVGI